MSDIDELARLRREVEELRVAVATTDELHRVLRVGHRALEQLLAGAVASQPDFLPNERMLRGAAEAMAAAIRQYETARRDAQ